MGIRKESGKRRTGIALCLTLAMAPGTGRACGPTLPFIEDSPVAAFTGMVVGAPLFVAGFAAGALACAPAGVVYRLRGKRFLQPVGRCAERAGVALGLAGFSLGAAPIWALDKLLPAPPR